jgi:EmrB/QacA subfamily drug resistance transporter
METEQDLETVGPRTHYSVTLAVLAVGVGGFAFMQSLVIPVLPTVQHGLHTSQTGVTWVLTAFLLSASIFTPILGRLGDMHGKKHMFVVALLALGLGSLLCALATSLTVMIIGRVIQGIGGGVLPLGFGIIRDEFPPEKVHGAVGRIAGLTAAGGGLGIVLAGPLVGALNYHWLFWLSVIVFAVAAVAAFRLVPESPVRTKGRINWTAAVLLSGWLVALLVAASQAPTWGWGSSKVLGLLAVAVVLGAIWITVETRSDTPLIDMKMMRIRAVWTTNLVAVLYGVGLYAMFAFVPQFVQTPTTAGYGFGSSITMSGLMMLPLTVAMFAMGELAGRLAKSVGAKNLVVAGSAISAIGFGFLTLQHNHQWDIYVATGVLGLGFGLAVAAMSGVIVVSVPHAQTGVASGMNANFRTIGGSLGAAFMASVVTANLTPTGLPHGSGYTNGFLMLTLAMLLGALAALLIPARVRTQHYEVTHPELALTAAGTIVTDESE